MRCIDCHGTYILHHETLKTNSFMIGKFEVEDIDFYACNGCGKQAYSEKTCKAIEKERGRIKNNLLQSLPIKDFIDLKDTAKILNVTKQAIYKSRIRRFLYSIKVYGKTLYNKKSVKLYKEAGDGRFYLRKEK